MLYIRVNPDRIFIVSEYWILIPLIVSIEIAIVVRIRKNRAQHDIISKKLKKDFIRWKIFNVTIGNVFSSICVRGGEEVVKSIADGFLQVHHEDCLVPKGVQFLDNEWLRKLLLIHHSDKIKPGIRYITRMTLCQFASKVSLGILDTQVFKVSSWLTVGKKTFVTIIASLPIPLLGIWGVTTIPVILSVVTF